MNRIVHMLAALALVAILMVIMITGYSEEISMDTEDQIPVEVAFDITRWDQYWKPGEKKLENSEETRNRIESVLLLIDQESAGTSIREGADRETD